MIIVTGCDNTGKTSLAEHLSKKFGFPIAKRFSHLPPQGEEWNQWGEWVEQELEKPGELIYDRFFIDELVYGPVIRSGYGLSIREITMLSGMLLMKQPMYIYTKLPMNELLKSFEVRKQYIAPSDVSKILSQFNHVNSTWPVKDLSNMTRFSYINDSNYQRIDRVVETYLMRKGELQYG